MKRLLFFICTLLCANVLFAQSFWEGDLHYTITGAGEVEVNGYNDSVTSVNIPSSVTHNWKHYNFSCDCYITDSVRTYSVTSIRNSLFRWNSSLTSVTIGNSVTYIGYDAFSFCSSLTSVTIGNSVTYIGDGAFCDCDSLTSITIPNSVDTIDAWAFSGCSSLTSVNIPNSDIYLSIGVFQGSGPSRCITIDSIDYAVSVPIISVNFPIFQYGLITCHIGDTTYRPTKAYVSPDNHNISGHVNILSSIEIAGNTYPVTSIFSEAFQNCSTLTSVTIPNSVTSIGWSAFSGCSSLTSVNIPNSVTEIRNSTFFGCSSLTSVNIGNSVTSIEEEAFRYCSRLTSVNIGNSVTSIEEEAFRYCSRLTSVTIPNSVTSIGQSAFRGCSSLTSVTCLATNPPALGGYVFDNIGYPSTLYVPNGCRQAYVNSAWAQYFDCILELDSNNSIAELDVEVNNEEWGSVEVYEGFCGIDTLTAVVEEDCSKFLHWNDGNTDNPRVVNVTSDTSFTAIFKDPVLDTTIDATIMQGETYNFNGQEFSEEGVYNATVLSVLGCEINLTVILYVISNDYTNGETSSLQETELEEIVFYPNPTKGLISFSKTIERIEVVDISGKILLSFSNVREINIGDLPAGSYLLRLHSNENSVLRKIVKE